MKEVLVSLVSDQTVPNILGIHHFHPPELLFISTEEMESKGKVDHTLNAVNLQEGMEYERGRNVHVLTVQEDSILDCHRALEKWMQDREDDEFIINLTGGTKLMAIAVFEFFKDYSSKMIYIPVSKNAFISPFPKKTLKKPEEIDRRLNVIEYLAAYGLKVLNKDKLSKNHDTAEKRKKLTAYIMENYRELRPLLGWFNGKLNEVRHEKKITFRERFDCHCREEQALFSGLGFDEKGGCYTKVLLKPEISFLTGGWLEEYCFNIVDEFVGKGVDDAALNIMIENARARNNEFDVMFTSGNALYFIECKSLDQEHDKNWDVLYKIGALQKEFGLRVESFLVTTSPNILDNEGKVKKHIADRAEQFKTKVLTPSEVADFKPFLAKQLKI
ncbi:MAG: DUF1887 family CARF protein [Syntrophales bacterium]|jgi:hypothetical protein|nr:DUF1887 family CARF protein [Syntrophales bacterium]